MKFPHVIWNVIKEPLLSVKNAPPETGFILAAMKKNVNRQYPVELHKISNK